MSKQILLEETSHHITLYALPDFKISPFFTHQDQLGIITKRLWGFLCFVLLGAAAAELTQLDSVGLLSISSALLDQGGKGHRQDVFALPWALASPGYLGQLHMERQNLNSTLEHFRNMKHCALLGSKDWGLKPQYLQTVFIFSVGDLTSWFCVFLFFKHLSLLIVCFC